MTDKAIMQYLQCEHEKKQFECTPSIEMFYDKEKMCYRVEFDLVEGHHKLNFLNNRCILGKIGFEFILENNISKKQILDIYYTNSAVNINIKHRGKLIVRFLSNITTDLSEIIKTIYCVPSNLHDEYYSHVPQGTSTYFAII